MKDKYKSMKRNKKIRINDRTNAPVNVPVCASEHLSLRVTPSLKEYFRNQSSSQKLSMTKYVLNIFDNYLDHSLLKEITSNKPVDKNIQNRIAGRSKLENTSWDGLQKVWNFIKCV
jgi:hypothetical protein